MKKIFLSIIFLLQVSNAFAYPNFIGHGYNSCVTCHYNPYGSGPLTDYGRGVAATGIADRLIIHTKGTTEEEISETSGFLYMKEFTKYIRPSIDYRGLYLDRDVDKNDGESTFINMQADINTVIRYKGENSYFISLSYGYAPKPKTIEGKVDSYYRTREHYLGMRLRKNLGVYIGLMDKVYGLRVPDHIAFSRSITGLSHNDQTHGVMLHLNSEDYEVGIHGFIGNLVQDKDLRQKGGSGKFEYHLTPRIKPGFSILSSKSDYFSNQLFSLHSKIGLSKGSSLMVELGNKSTENLISKTEVDTVFGFLQNHILLRRGLYFIMTSEYLKQDAETEKETYRLGPGVQFFPFQGVELRADIYNSKSYDPNSATSDSWDFTSQVHLWF